MIIFYNNVSNVPILFQTFSIGSISRLNHTLTSLKCFRVEEEQEDEIKIQWKGAGGTNNFNQRRE